MALLVDMLEIFKSSYPQHMVAWPGMKICIMISESGKSELEKVFFQFNQNFRNRKTQVVTAAFSISNRKKNLFELEKLLFLVQIYRTLDQRLVHKNQFLNGLWTRGVVHARAPESGKSKLEKVVFLVQIDFFFYLKQKKQQ